MKNEKLKINKFPFVFLFIFLCGSLLLLPGNRTKETTDKKSLDTGKEKTLREFVDVVNIEVIVRALRGKKLVPGLKQEDFSLFEDGERLNITSFSEVRRKVGLNNPGPGKGSAGASLTKAPVKNNKRLFFLYFWLSEPDTRVFRTMDYFFQHVYQANDYVLLMVGNKVFKILRPHQVPEMVKRAKDEIFKEAKHKKFRRDRLMGWLSTTFREFFIDFQRNELLGAVEEQVTLMNRALSKYRSAWHQYKTQHIALESNKLKAIAASLKGVALEKWALVFYQHDSFPHLNTERIYTQRRETNLQVYEMRKEVEKLFREMSKTSRGTKFMDEIQQAFINANTTLHLLLSSKRTTGNIEAQFFTIANVHSDWQEAFKKVSAATGGQIIENNKLDVSLKKVIAREDIYYRLTFSPPKTDKKARNIDLRANDKTINLMYHRKVRVRRPGEISIENFSFNQPKLQFSLNNYRQFFDGNRLFGDIFLRITSVDSKGAVRTFQQEFEPDHSQMDVSTNVKFPRKGKYTLILEVLDQQSGKSARLRQKVDIIQQ